MTPKAIIIAPTTYDIETMVASDSNIRNIPKIIKKIELNRDDLKIFDIKLFICPPLFYYNTFFINIH